MPIKHQLYSYRIRAGVAYKSDGDILDSNHRELAKQRVAELRAQGKKAFAEHHKDGYSRVFVDSGHRF